MFEEIRETWNEWFELLSTSLSAQYAWGDREEEGKKEAQGDGGQRGRRMRANALEQVIAATNRVDILDPALLRSGVCVCVCVCV